MSIRDGLRDWFTFSRQERYGVLVLCVLIIVALAVRLYLPTRQPQQVHDTVALGEALSLFNPSNDDWRSSEPESVVEQAEAERRYFVFDPNTATPEQWKQLGLNERQIKNVRNYIAKGGSFRRKEDFKKLYTITAPLYAQLEPYIRIAKTDAKSYTRPKTAEERSPSEERPTYPKKPAAAELHLELNTADSASLVELRGIGPVFASRIVKYRKRLGGFVSAAQLGEVYGMDSTVLASLEPQLSADTSKIQRIAVNKASFKDLISHPYLDKQQTQGILHYKKLQKSVKSLNELVRNHILTEEEATRIAPYLSFE